MVVSEHPKGVGEMANLEIQAITYSKKDVQIEFTDGLNFNIAIKEGAGESILVFTTLTEDGDVITQSEEPYSQRFSYGLGG